MPNSTECVHVLNMSSDKEKTKSGPGEHRQGEKRRSRQFESALFPGAPVTPAICGKVGCLQFQLYLAVDLRAAGFSIPTNVTRLICLNHTSLEVSAGH